MDNLVQHYHVKKIPSIVLIRDFITENTYDAYESYIIGNMLKYMYRFPHKGCGVTDIEKIIHYATFLK